MQVTGTKAYEGCPAVASVYSKATTVHDFWLHADSLLLRNCEKPQPQSTRLTLASELKILGLELWSLYRVLKLRIIVFSDVCKQAQPSNEDMQPVYECRTGFGGLQVSDKSY